MEFGIRAWAACAPALQSAEAWQAWSHHPWLPTGSELPPLAAMAPMLRRRVNAIGRAALHPAYACLPDSGLPDASLPDADGARGTFPGTLPGTPSVFASRHGDTGRAFAMLSDLAAGEPISPTAFGLSVHNAIGAMLSIDRADPANLQAVAAGRDTVETAVVESCGLLADGAPEVLLVVYDAPLPDAYAPFADEPGCLFGWCWRIGAPRAGKPVYRLTLEAALNPADSADAAGTAGENCASHASAASRAAGVPGTAPPVLPHALDVLRFMLAGEPELRHRGARALWRWQRHG